MPDRCAAHNYLGDAPCPQCAPSVVTAQTPSMADAAEMLWVVLANVSGGDWTKQSTDWQEAAARWRDNYFAALKAASAPSVVGQAPKEPKAIADMRRASELIDDAADATAYQLGLISLALMTRKFLRELPASPAVGQAPKVELDNHHNALACPYCNPNGRLIDPYLVAQAPATDLTVAASFVLGGWSRTTHNDAELLAAIREGIERSPIAEVVVVRWALAAPSVPHQEKEITTNDDDQNDQGSR